MFVMSYRIVSVLNFKLFFFLLNCEIMEEFYRKKKSEIKSDGKQLSACMWRPGTKCLAPLPSPGL